MNESIATTLTQFHFIRAELLLLIPLAIAFWYGAQRFSRSSEWADYIPKHMLAVLRVQNETKSSWLRWAWLAIWVIICMAAAGPSWVKQSTPALQNQSATVILLDLSPSMLAQDLKPNRLTRAKFKLIDILRRLGDGQVALVAYAGDAHTVSPLTDDPATIEALLPALYPNIMPSQGSNTEAAMRLAQQLLTDAGLNSGQILLLSDGVSDTAKTVMRKELKANNSVSILAIGSNETTSIPSNDGGVVRNNRGEIVLSKVEHRELNTLAKQLNGRFARISNSDSDLDQLLTERFDGGDYEQGNLGHEFDAWADAGHWLVLLILPLFLLFFRKGFIYCLPILLFVPMQSDAADAWNKLWKTPDQQAAELLEQQEYEKAAETFKRQDWSAIADYKNGNYENAADKLSNKQDATSLYNRGNALAMSGKLEDAINAYDDLLAKHPDHQDSLHNKELVKKLLEQQKQDQDQQQGSDNSDSENSDSENSDSENPDSENPDSENSDSENSDSENSEEKNAQGQESDNEPVDQEPSANQEPSSDSEQSPKQGAEGKEGPDAGIGQAELDESPDQLKDSSEKWLRSIQEDPSGLLRRKFQYQSRLRERQGLKRSQSGDQERY